ncbi:MAG TPA: histidine phosphatase family protein [Anaerolineae bacterium]|nr:histidine phosphatase family protein [Anaerolineae bacterium]HNU04289.1 histidine phosphatase family protein [Anaerolineae bacterium]
MSKLFLIRHATPDWSRTDIPYFVPPGPPLSPQGLEEAQGLAAFLQPAGVQRLFTSPLERCLHTAQIVSAVTGAPLEVADGLHEWQPHENKEIVLARALPLVQQLWQEITANAAAGPVALFTHGGPILALLSALGQDDATLEKLRIYDHQNTLPPAGVWQVSMGDHGQAGEYDLHLVYVPPAARPVA